MGTPITGLVRLEELTDVEVVRLRREFEEVQRRAADRSQRQRTTA